MYGRRRQQVQSTPSELLSVREAWAHFARMPNSLRHSTHDFGRTRRLARRPASWKGCRRRRNGCSSGIERRIARGGFCEPQRVIRAPSLLKNVNRYACLDVDEINDDLSNVEEVIEAAQDLPKRRVRIRRLIWRPMWERRLRQKYVLAAMPSSKSLSVDIELQSTETGIRRSTKALVDCGATGQFLDSKYVTENRIPTRTLSRPIEVFNVDGTSNEAGMIREIADLVLRYDGHSERVQFAVTQLGKQTAILGFTWLEKHNPKSIGKRSRSKCRGALRIAASTRSSRPKGEEMRS